GPDGHALGLDAALDLRLLAHPDLAAARAHPHRAHDGAGAAAQVGLQHLDVLDVRVDAHVLAVLRGEITDRGLPGPAVRAAAEILLVSPSPALWHALDGDLASRRALVGDDVAARGIGLDGAAEQILRIATRREKEVLAGIELGRLGHLLRMAADERCREGEER